MKPSIKKIFGQKLQLSTILSIWDHNKSNRWENTTTHAILVKADEGSESNFEQIKDMTQEIQWHASQLVKTLVPLYYLMPV